MTVIVCRVMLKGGLFVKLTKSLLSLISAILDVISLPNFSLSCTVPARKSNIGGACIIINSQWRKLQLKKEKKRGGERERIKKTKTPGVECALCDNYEMSSLFFTALLY